MHQSAHTASVPNLRGLYVITDERLGGGHLRIARAGISGGARVLQLRDKTASDAELLPIAREIRKLTSNSGVLFVMNDRLELALKIGADGVHLGPGDLAVEQARRIAGNDFLIGASCGTPEEARVAEHDSANYIGAGAVFGTATKLDAGEAIGLETLRQIVSSTRLPVAAIGGINACNIASTIEAGAQMACVVSAVASAGNEIQMANAARELVIIFNEP